MAADPRRNDAVKKRPLSAPKNAESSSIPRIVLDDRVDADLVNNDNKKTHETSAAGAGTSAGISGVAGDAANNSPEPHEYVPHRCNSDIGLPTISMPNLSLAMSLGEGASGDKLGVYCSPRTTRRSVDLDVGSSRDHHAREEYEWLDDKSSSLRVLSASSRVGSAVSLNSVCTAHSVGLISNDSSDDYQDSSLHDNSSSCQGERQLRRLMSYPEEDKTTNDANVSPRTSYSLCNLKAAQTPDGQEQSQGEGQGQLTPEKLCLLPSELDDSDARQHSAGTSKGVDGRKSDTSDAKIHDHKTKTHIVAYGKPSNSMREGRIRRWLQDMDSVG